LRVDPKEVEPSSYQEELQVDMGARWSDGVDAKYKGTVYGAYQAATASSDHARRFRTEGAWYHSTVLGKEAQRKTNALYIAMGTTLRGGHDRLKEAVHSATAYGDLLHNGKAALNDLYFEAKPSEN
jgi:hypothetical protein